jgi:hypothetical protein
MYLSSTTYVDDCFFLFFFSPFTSLVTSRPANTSNKVDLPAPKYIWYYDSDDELTRWLFRYRQREMINNNMQNNKSTWDDSSK